MTSRHDGGWRAADTLPSTRVSPLPRHSVDVLCMPLSGDGYRPGWSEGRGVEAGYGVLSADGGGLRSGSSSLIFFLSIFSFWGADLKLSRSASEF